MSAVSKAMYMPLQIATSVAGACWPVGSSTEIWQRISPSDQEPPDPKDLNRSGREAISAAALQGLVFGLVRAAVSRVGRHRVQPEVVAQLVGEHPASVRTR